MDAKVLIGVLVMALLVVGCGGQQAPAADQGADQQDMDQQEDDQAVDDSGEGIDFSEYDSIADLKSLREGVVCEATHDAGFQGTWKLKGSNVHMMGTVKGTTAETVIKDNTMYMRVPEGQSGMDCAWLSMDLDSVDSQETEQAPGEYKKPEDTSLIDYNCRQEDVPDSEFEVSGSVCDLSEMMEGMGMPSDGSMPEGMPEDMPDY